MEDIIKKSQKLFKKTIIPRKRYYDRLDNLLKTKQIIVVQGQRRVGKSFIVMWYLKKLHINLNSIFFFNKELDNKNTIKTHIELSDLYDTFVKKHGEPKYIFIDEIQDIVERERFIRAKFTEWNQKIIISWSNAHLLSTELTTYLTGRYIPLEVFPLDYQEYLFFSKKEHSNKTFEEYTRWWGMPEITFIDDEAEKEDYLKSVLNTILFKDIVTRFSIKEPAYLEKILNYFADTIWSPISLRNIRSSSQSYGWDISSLTTLSNYVAYLELPYLMYKVSRFDLHWKKILEHNEKYYFNDLWMRNTLRVQMEIDIGKIIENMVYLHLRKMGYKIYIWNIGNKEIDFVAKKGNEITYIQVAYVITDDKTRDREFDNLLEIKDAYPKMVVSTDALASSKHKGIQRVNIYDFIKDFK